MAVFSNRYSNVREARNLVKETDFASLYVFEDGSMIIPSGLRNVTFRPLGQVTWGSNIDHIGKIFKAKSEELIARFHAMKDVDERITAWEKRPDLQGIPPRYLAYAVLRGIPVFDEPEELKGLRRILDAMVPEFNEVELDLRFIAKLIEVHRAAFDKSVSKEIQIMYGEFLYLCECCKTTKS